MSDFERLKEVVEFLRRKGLIYNQKDLADQLDYNESSMSQFVNGATPITKPFLLRLKNRFPMINLDYINKGIGEIEVLVVKEPEVAYKSTKSINIPLDVWDVIKKQADSLKKQANSLEARDRQIDELISMLCESPKKERPAEDQKRAVK